jgi:hypothetical protein
MEQMLGVSSVTMRRKGKSNKARHGKEESDEKQSHSNVHDQQDNSHPSNVSAVVGIYRSAVASLTGSTTPMDMESMLKIISLDRDGESTGSTIAAILISGDKNSMIATLINVTNKHESVGAEFIPHFAVAFLLPLCRWQWKTWWNGS